MGFRRRFVESDVAANIAWSTSSIGAVASQSVKCQRQRAAAVRGAPAQPSEPSSLAEFGNSSACAAHRSPQCAGEQNPDDDAVANQAHIEKLEKAVEILGEESPQAQGLIAALKQARERAVVPPIGVPLDSCQAFVKRARKRLTVAEEEVTKALRTKRTREFELEQGLERLAQLREEAAILPQPSSTAAEVNLLRATVAELRREQVSLMVELAQQTETDRAIERSGRMETFIDDADADLRASQRFTPN